MKQGRPFLKGVGNPVRALLNIADSRIQVRRKCLNPRCIEPTHWRVICEQPWKYDDLPPPVWTDPRSGFSAQELADIEEALEMLANNELTIEDLGHLQLRVLNEIRARATAQP
ncbi:MAG: hypothetical protein EOR24_18440 [Mesorhizobium sp.]|nr:MAG: hypothetical protein EOR24_18440 [Mesorhizobium sp.]